MKRAASAVVLAAAALTSLAAGARADDATDLRKQLEERDKAIEDLRRRVETLEAGKPAPAPTAPPATAADPRKDERTAEEDLALQALSRTLVARGALLLPEWGLEVAPGVTYSHSQTDGVIVEQTAGGLSLVTSQRQRRDEIIPNLVTRLGLPWDSQISLRLPYSFRRRASSLADGNGGVLRESGLGDIELEVAHQILREGGWQPDLLAAVTGRAPTGGDPYDDNANSLATGTGVWGVTGRLTATKSQDPLVFFGTLTYTANLPATKGVGKVDPGDIFGVEFGTIFAVSPETSLTLSLSQAFTGKTQLNGTSLSGTDQTVATLNLGASTVLDGNILLDLTVAIGLTSDSPDYQVMLSLPIRFSL